MIYVYEQNEAVAVYEDLKLTVYYRTYKDHIRNEVF